MVYPTFQAVEGRAPSRCLSQELVIRQAVSPSSLVTRLAQLEVTTGTTYLEVVLVEVT